MNKNRSFSLLLVFVAVAFALAGASRAWTDEDNSFKTKDLRGRYITATHGDDISSVTSGDVSTTPGDVDPAINFSSTSVLISDGFGDVCGESSGFYGFPEPGSNSGPTTFHGVYTVDPLTGRVQIDTCADAGPFCAIRPPNCAGAPPGCTDPSTGCADPFAINNHKTLLGYLQDHNARQFTSVERVNGAFSSGFIVTNRTWERAGQ